MSLKNYIVGMIIGVFCGALVAILSAPKTKTSMATRNIASSKLMRLPRKAGVGKVAAPVFVQIFGTEESRPKDGYYKLVAHITFNTPVSHLHYNWSLPSDVQIISGSPEGDVQLAQGEEDWEEIIEIQSQNLSVQQNILFDLNFQQNGSPLGSSDLYILQNK